MYSSTGEFKYQQPPAGYKIKDQQDLDIKRIKEEEKKQKAINFRKKALLTEDLSLLEHYSTQLLDLFEKRNDTLMSIEKKELKVENEISSRINNLEKNIEQIYMEHKKSIM